MVGVLDSESSGPGSSPGRGRILCCVLGQDTLLLQCLSPARFVNGYRRIASHPGGSRSAPSRFMVQKLG